MLFLLVLLSYTNVHVGVGIASENKSREESEASNKKAEQEGKEGEQKKKNSTRWFSLMVAAKWTLYILHLHNFTLYQTHNIVLATVSTLGHKRCSRLSVTRK